MQAVRDHVNAAVETGRVHPRLIGNFDQVWTMRQTPEKTQVFKDSSKGGQSDEPVEPHTLHQLKAREALLLHLGKPEMTKLCLMHPVSAPPDLKGQVQVVMNNRSPRTVTTWSWRDGTMGLTYITFAEGDVSVAEMEELNEFFGPMGAIVDSTGP